MAESNKNLLIEAKSLQLTVQQLRSKLENAISTPHHEQNSSDSPKENFQKDLSETKYAGESSFHGIHNIQNSSVAIFGDMQHRGLYVAETLIRCGTKKIILFDNEDAMSRVQIDKNRWESVDNPSFELETYVSCYELNEDSFEHFVDRLAHGGYDNLPVDLLILTDSAMSSEVFDLTVRAIQTVGCSLIRYDRKVVYLIDSYGKEVVFRRGMTLVMAALDFLLVKPL